MSEWWTSVSRSRFGVQDKRHIAFPYPPSWQDKSTPLILDGWSRFRFLPTGWERKMSEWCSLQRCIFVVGRFQMSLKQWGQCSPSPWAETIDTQWWYGTGSDLTEHVRVVRTLSFSTDRIKARIFQILCDRCRTRLLGMGPHTQHHGAKTRDKYSLWRLAKASNVDFSFSVVLLQIYFKRISCLSS